MKANKMGTLDPTTHKFPEFEAFKAGWSAHYRSTYLEWGPAPPDNPEDAYKVWKGIPLPKKVTTKQLEYLYSLGYGQATGNITLAVASKMINQALEERRQGIGLPNYPNEEDYDWEYDEYGEGDYLW